MTLQQLEYIVAVEQYGHIIKAAEVCKVTQPALSMAIQRLEEELQVRIFDRSKHPITPTEIGSLIIRQAKSTLHHFRQINEIVASELHLPKGKFRLGVITTVASYLVPVLLSKRMLYEDIKLEVYEMTTDRLVKALREGSIDGGLLVTPLNQTDLIEIPVYYEKFYAYVSPDDPLYSEATIDVDKLGNSQLWLLQNEHCLRGQVLRLCNRAHTQPESGVRFTSGSVDTLIRVVDYNPGLTILPEMFTMGLTEEQQEHLRPIANRTAVREVSMVISNEFVRKTILEAILEMVRAAVPQSMQNIRLKEFMVPL